MNVLVSFNINDCVHFREDIPGTEMITGAGGACSEVAQGLGPAFRQVAYPNIEN